MEELSDILRVLLKRIPYHVFLRGELDCMALNPERTAGVLHGYMSAYSDTELWNMVDSLHRFLKDYSRFLGSGKVSENLSVFDAVFRFSDGMLIRRNNTVKARYERLLRWRTTTKDVGEELFVVAFLARHDQRNEIYCRDFTWPVVIGHSNIQLKKMTDQGMAENHFHLWGSAPYFPVTWIWMMNHVTQVQRNRRINELHGNARTVSLVYGQNSYGMDLKESCLRAALIRLFLYASLKDLPLELGPYYMEGEELSVWTDSFQAVIPAEEAAGFSGMEVQGVLHTIASYVPGRERELTVFRRICRKEVDFSLLSARTGVCPVSGILTFILRQQGRVCLQECRELFSLSDFRQLMEQKAEQRVFLYLQDPNLLRSHLEEIQDEMDRLRTASFLEEAVDDYALNALTFHGYQEHEENRILSGERWFQYEMLRRIDAKDRTLTVQMCNLFYAYLLIKEEWRGELVQSNDWVGFENFSIYNGRSGLMPLEQPLEELKARMAVLSCIRQNVRKLELRITPRNTARENYEEIRFLDHAIDPGADREEDFSDRIAPGRAYSGGTDALYGAGQEPRSRLRESTFYVLHFIKRKDGTLPEQLCSFRHASLRSDVARKTRALLDFRHIYPETAARVLGIDAASQEIGCRPEVFAQAFRTLHEDTSYACICNEYVKLPQLRATYHVGEDFLDVADGLRAIDEAILFLNLDCGDRLGHALALGISVKDWYASKTNHISIPQQDYLDNIVWLYFALIRYGICCMDNLKNRIETEFYQYFGDIYGKYMDQEFLCAIQEAQRTRKAQRMRGSRRVREVQRMRDVQGHSVVNLNFDIHAYYDSWKLRGDSPELYRNGYYDNDGTRMTAFDLNAVNYLFPSEFRMREKPESAILYYYYHYSKEVREAGQKNINIRVDYDYVQAVDLVQKAMQQEIAKRGIGIETNPSSNVMIGTFSRYDEHPIIRFYNNGLTVDSAQLKECPQLWVSINTDDQGVFDTKLENEYAFMARALEKKVDEKGEQVYSKSMIYDWLDRIREMGLRQSFLEDGKNGEVSWHAENERPHRFV